MRRCKFRRVEPETPPRSGSPIQLVPIRTNDIWHRFSPSLLFQFSSQKLHCKRFNREGSAERQSWLAFFVVSPFVVAASVLHVTLLLAFSSSLVLPSLPFSSCSKCHTNVEHVMFCHYACKWNAAAAPSSSHVDHMPSMSADEVGIFPIIRIASLCVWVCVLI